MKATLKVLLLSILFLISGVFGQDESLPDGTEALNNLQEDSDLATTGNLEIYQGLILGVGPGTFIVIMVAIFSSLFCLFKDCATCPNVCVGVGIGLPILTYLIIRQLPVKSLESDATKTDRLPTDSFYEDTQIFTALLLVASIVLCCLAFGSNFSMSITGTR